MTLSCRAEAGNMVAAKKKKARHFCNQTYLTSLLSEQVRNTRPRPRPGYLLRCIVNAILKS